MKVGIGTRSVPKTIAVMRAFSKYPELWIENEDKIEYIVVQKEKRNNEKVGNEKDEFSGVSCSPLSVPETIKGAKNRAKSIYEHVLESEKECSFGVGIESGMYEVEESQSGYMDHCVCAIYDGARYYLGFGPSFEYPKEAVERVLNGEEIGYMTDIFGDTAKGRKGAIGVLTQGRLYRDEIEEYAVFMALTQIVSKDIYK